MKIEKKRRKIRINNQKGGKKSEERKEKRARVKTSFSISPSQKGSNNECIR